MDKTIELTAGSVVLTRPKAGARNKALMKAEQESKSKEPSKTVFVMELLPHCVKSHPWGTTPIRQALDSLEMEEYDKLASALGELINPLSESDQKK